MKSSSDGPPANVAANVVVFDTVGPDIAGVAKERVFLITEARTRHEWVRTRDIVSQRVLNADAFPEKTRLGGSLIRRGVSDRYPCPHQV